MRIKFGSFSYVARKEMQLPNVGKKLSEQGEITLKRKGLVWSRQDAALCREEGSIKSNWEYRNFRLMFFQCYQDHNAHNFRICGHINCTNLIGTA